MPRFEIDAPEEATRVRSPGISLPAIQHLFDELARTQRAQTEDIAGAVSAKLATVVGRSGEGAGTGNIRVRFDDEDEDRSIGLPRSKGVNFATGDRIVVLRNEAGDYIAGFPITSADNLSSEEAVTYRQVVWGSITRDRLDPDTQNRINAAITGLIQSGDIASGAVTGGKIANDVIDWQHLRGDSSHLPGSLGYDLERLVNFAKGKGWI